MEERLSAEKNMSNAGPARRISGGVLLAIVITFRFIFGIGVAADEFISEREKVFVEDDFVEAIYSLIVFIF